MFRVTIRTDDGERSGAGASVQQAKARAEHGLASWMPREVEVRTERPSYSAQALLTEPDTDTLIREEVKKRWP